MLNLLPTLEPRYTCPGETHAISRAVHLSRLAAFYPPCRECPHRHETGQFVLPHIAKSDDEKPQVTERSLFTLEGVRGIYLNELTRQKAADLATAFASLLWDSISLTGRNADVPREVNSKRPLRRIGPVVVVGYDERPSSPDLVNGVAAALRRMSCQVVDIGRTSVPGFRFAVAHLQASGGVMVTGHGCEPSWTGLDFVARGGRPVSALGEPAPTSTEAAARGISLQDLRDRLEFGVARPLRQGGTHRWFQSSVPYLAGMWKHFHALRPLQVVVGCPVGLVRQSLLLLFEQLPVKLHWVEIPQRAREVLRADDEDVGRVRVQVISQAADFGFLIDDDGAGAAVLDEQGQLLGPDQLLCLASDVLLAEQPGAAVAVENAARERLANRISARGARCWLGGWTQSEMWQTLRNDAAICGGGAGKHLWLRESWPVADAILTLAKVLQALSRDDAPLSHVVAESNSVERRADSAEEHIPSEVPAAA